MSQSKKGHVKMPGGIKHSRCFGRVEDAYVIYECRDTGRALLRNGEQPESNDGISLGE